MIHPQKYVVKWMLQELRKRKQFTTREAVDLYLTKPRTRFGVTDDAWREMNARNCLTAAVQMGLLVRVRRGLYRWPKEKP